MTRLLLVVLAVGLVVTGCSSSSKTAQSTSTTGPSQPDVITTPPFTLAATTTTAPPVDVVIGNKGFTSVPPSVVGPTITYAVIIQNADQTHAADNVSVNVTFTDSAGTVIASDTDSIDAILPAQTAAVGNEQLQSSGPATTMNVQAKVGRWEEAAIPTGGFQGQGVTVTTQAFGRSYETSIRGTIVSTFTRDIQKPKAVAVLYNAAGAIIGGAYTFVDFVPANGRASFSMNLLNTNGAARRAEAYANLTSLSLAPR